VHGIPLLAAGQGTNVHDNHFTAKIASMGRGLPDRSMRTARDKRSDATPKLQVDREQIASFCRRWDISELALFGSAARDEFRSDSDMDVLVTFAGSSRRTLSDMIGIEAELEGIFGRKADVLTRPSVERSRSYIFRRQVLQDREPLYVA
jgi:predicted nucleotidyltransferase